MLELKNITKEYVTASETVSALKGVSLAFRDREFVSILGPSGCGKTTLLNIIGGLDRYTSGDLIINGRSTRSYRDRDWDVYRNHRVGFIFQSYNLIPHQTILGNVELALTIAGIGKEERVARAKSALDKVGLKGQYYKRPNQLSGGQCQRVAIARALVNDPEILLADEPTGALDTVTSVQIMNLIKEISRERLVIMVTHNPELAMQYSTRIIRLLDGRVIQDTRPVSPAEIIASGGKKSRRQLKRNINLSLCGNLHTVSAVISIPLISQYIKTISQFTLISFSERTNISELNAPIQISAPEQMLSANRSLRSFLAFESATARLSLEPLAITQRSSPITEYSALVLCLCCSSE